MWYTILVSELQENTSREKEKKDAERNDERGEKWC